MLSDVGRPHSNSSSSGPHAVESMNFQKLRFELCLRQSSGDVEVPKHVGPTLSSMWALEDTDLMQLSVDILELPEFEPILVPTLKLKPMIEATSKPLRRRSLASLKRDRALGISTARQVEQPSDVMSLCQEIHACRQKMRKEHARPSTENYNPSSLAFAGTNTGLSVPLLMAKTTGCLPLINVQPASITDCIPPQEPNTASEKVLAGAASLGLRRRRNRATSEPPVQLAKRFLVPASKEKHSMINSVKDKIHLDGSSAAAKLQQIVKETARMPCAPQQPQPAGYRKRPQVRGVAVLVV